MGDAHGFVRWFSELTNKDINIAGGKGASLAEMYNNKFPVPPGFIVTAQAYDYFIEKSGLRQQIFNILNSIDVEDTHQLEGMAKKIRGLIEDASMPVEMRNEIVESYEMLDVSKGKFQGASHGALAILKNSREPPFVAVRSSATMEDLADASFAGQQESFLNVKGADSLILHVKRCFASLFTARAIYYRKKKGFASEKGYLAVVVQKMIDSQKSGVMFSKNPLKNDGNIIIEAVFGLGEGIVSGMISPDHYILNQKLELIEQSRPITTKSYEHVQEIEGNVLFSGLAASPGVASGVVKIIHSLTELNKIVKGNVLVTKMTNPDMVMAMAKSVAIITDEGGSTSHAAIVSREMGIPAVVGTHDATTKLKDGQIVTVDGFTGRIFEGKTVEKKVEIKKMLPTNKIKIKVIVDLPDYAVRAASCGADSVGLVRLETLIATSGKHPVWYIKKNKLNDYVSVLHNGLRKLSQPFHEIWIRTSDVRSDEFRNLEGAPETVEMNPMLGDHGIRFSLKNEDLLVAEFTAIKELADEYSNKIFGVMFPQIISAEELKSAKKIAERVKFPSNVKIGIMVETPAAVQVINDLCEEGMDFISFGTNDLTQYTLAIDRNNEDVQNLYTELNPAVLNSIAYVIRRCKKYGVETSVCGQAGSKPEMVKFLLKEGIDSVSVNADAAYNVSVIVNELEKAVVEPVKIIKKMNGDNVVKIRRMNSNSQPHALESHVVHGGMMSPMRPMLHASDSNSNSQITMKSIESLGIENDDYNPGKGVTSDIPSLNDSMSVSSEDFASKNSETEVLDMSTEEIPKSDIPYEIQQDVIFDAIVGAEVASNPAMQQQTMQIPGTEGMSLDV